MNVAILELAVGMDIHEDQCLVVYVVKDSSPFSVNSCPSSCVWCLDFKLFPLRIQTTPSLSAVEGFTATSLRVEGERLRLWA